LLQKPIGIVDRIATVRVLVLLTLLSILFPTIIFPAAGIGEAQPLDLYFSYSPDQVYEYLDGLGAKGRIAYAKMELTTDLLFPVVYSLALTVALTIVSRKVLPLDSWLQDLRFLPFLVLVADWFENICLAFSILLFPDRSNATATAASFFTSLKWTFLLVALVTLVTGAALVARNQLRGGNRS
jgi:hypothetical protein